ncbi:MAG: hypothetical protein IPO21_00920 [Bacteroidales bacterium]|nr:hypothetical protein [Bacteroidales bacterium]
MIKERRKKITTIIILILPLIIIFIVGIDYLMLTESRRCDKITTCKKSYAYVLKITRDKPMNIQVTFLSYKKGKPVLVYSKENKRDMQKIKLSKGCFYEYWYDSLEPYVSAITFSGYAIHPDTVMAYFKTQGIVFNLKDAIPENEEGGFINFCKSYIKLKKIAG